jgi:CHASE2 domain-containing sensor protein/predicted Ser/Thr protein kinase
MSQLPDESTEPRTKLRQSDVVVRSQSSLWSKVPKSYQPLLTAILTGGVMALGVLGIRQLGLLQGTELRQYDQFVQLQPEALPDSRILVVGVTEEDITRYRWPLSDQLLDQAIDKISALNPRAIGLDIFRDLPIEPGHAALQKRFQTSDLLIPVCKIGDASSPGVAPPPNVPLDYVGFADNVTDPDGVVRRSLLYTSPSGGRCQATNSLALQLAISYLAADNIQPSQTDEGYPKLGNIVFQPITSHAGGYRHVDVRGYQTFLNFRSEKQVAQTVTLADVLDNKLKESWVQDRVVLIGYVASSLKDVFLTPYNTGKVDQQQMPGVVLHAQNVSQILSSVLDGRPLIGYWPEWAEAIWIIGWSLVGSVLAKRLENPSILALAGLIAVISLCGWGYLIFLQGLWVPIVPAAIALTFAALGGFCYDAYRLQQQQRQVSQQVQEQEKAIVLLQNLLKETQATAIQPTRPAPMGPSIASSDAAHATLIGERYRMKKVLGAGGFGQTFLAADTKRPGEPVCVVKWLRPARQDERFMAVARRLFSSEADILERLGQHNRIPQLLAYFEEQNDFYLVQDFIPGKSLAEELSSSKVLTEAQAMEIVRGILEVLVFVHHHQVIHRDIKPANLIRRESDKRLVLIDFGAVKQMQPGRQEEETRTVVIGTPGYAPPEQLKGQPNLSSDIYATGVIGIQALTGLHPTHLDSDQNTGELIWRDKAPNVSPGFANVIDKMVRYFFGNRYPTAIAALRDIEKLPR